MTTRTESMLQRLTQVVTLLSAVGALAVSILAYRSSEHAVGAQYVGIAVGILNAQNGQPNTDLRAWAVDLINEYSGTKLPTESATALKEGKITLYGAALAGEAKDTSHGEGTLH